MSPVWVRAVRSDPSLYRPCYSGRKKKVSAQFIPVVVPVVYYIVYLNSGVMALGTPVPHLCVLGFMLAASMKMHP